MRKLTVRGLWILTLLTVAFSAGCGDEQAPGFAPPAVVAVSPLNGATHVPITQVIGATFNEPMNPATITTSTFTLTGPAGVAITGAVAYSGTTATFTPALPLAPSALYTATITLGALDPLGRQLAANFVWSFTTGASPTVVSTVPANGAGGVPGSTMVSATFSEAMNALTITPATFTVTGPGLTAVMGVVGYSGVTATFTPFAALPANTLYTATITTGAKDQTGDPLAANYVWTFSTSPPPMVTSTSPASGASDVPLNQKVSATFNTPMTASTITPAGTFTLVPTAGGAAITGTVTYDVASNTATFAPAAALTASTEYTATVTTAAQSTGLQALAANYVWNFTTGLETNAGAPTVTSTDPLSAAVGVPLNQHVAATFSKAMSPATISATGTFTVAVTAGGAAVPGTVAYDAASDTAVFTPTAALAPSTEYTATITTAATDLTNVPMAANYVWNFTTGTTLNAVGPTITSTNPISAATAVPVTASINATFSAPMDPTTITNATFTVAVAGVGGAPVDGTVAYNPESQVATFTPSANLTADTTYTATVSTMVKDLTGNALVAGAAPNPWSFTTGSAAGLVAPTLGTAASFGTFGGGAGMTNTGINTVINGDIATTAVSTAVTGFNDAGVGCVYTETGSDVGVVNGTIDTAPPPPTGACPQEGTSTTFAIATQAATDALTAFNALSAGSLPGGANPGMQLGGLVLAPGVYTAPGGSFLLTGSDLTLDAQGNTKAVWVFQMASSLTVGAPGFPRNVILVNGAQAANVYWQVGSAATINPGGGGTMVGTIIASAGVVFSTVGSANITTLDGRALALNASVTMVNTVINVPAP